MTLNIPAESNPVNDHVQTSKNSAYTEPLSDENTNSVETEPIGDDHVDENKVSPGTELLGDDQVDNNENSSDSEPLADDLVDDYNSSTDSVEVQVGENLHCTDTESDENVEEQDEASLHDLKLDGGFDVPENNAFGHNFRDYNKESKRRASVAEFYRQNHMKQTYEIAKNKQEEYEKLDKAVMSIWECCELLNQFVDESDPDLDDPQIQHLLQSAEAIRRDYPKEDWLHLTALVHDLGKVLLHPAFGEQPQWSVVGDTFPLGCAFDESTVHHTFFNENPDTNHPIYSTKLGIYAENCGLDNVTMSWGHDEYMYLVAKGNNTTLPPAALFIIRFHSFYALHRSGAYTYLMSEEDKEMLKWLKVFNKYDLYSKSKVRINVEEVKPYYLSLIEKYFPAKLKW